MDWIIGIAVFMFFVWLIKGEDVFVSNTTDWLAAEREAEHNRQLLLFAENRELEMYLCAICGYRSSNPNDKKYSYCGHCHTYQPDFNPPIPR